MTITTIIPIAIGLTIVDDSGHQSAVVLESSPAFSVTCKLFSYSTLALEIWTFPCWCIYFEKSYNLDPKSEVNDDKLF